MRCVIISLAILAAGGSFAQTNGYESISTISLEAAAKPFTLPINQTWDDQPWRDSVYRFPEFLEGRFVLQNGFSPSTTVAMNYNLFLESIDVNDADGKIFALTKFEDIRFVWIGDHKFLRDPKGGFLEIIIDGPISVARRSYMKWSVAYVGGGGSYFQHTTVDDRSGASDIERKYWPAETYYIVGPDYKTRPFGPNVLPSLLPHMRSKIKKFAGSNEINYKSNEDLLKMVKFCNDNYVTVNDYTGDPVTLRLPVDSKLEQSMWKDSIYRFNQFSEGIVKYADGSKNESMLVNLDYSAGSFNTLDEKGDTIRVPMTQSITTVVTDDAVFSNDPVHGVLEVVRQGPISLGLKKQITKREFVSKSVAESFHLPHENVFEIERSYFFIRKNKAFRATPKMLISFLPQHKKEIEDYLNQHTLNFDSERDLTQLLSYCSQL
jgi:hypothetical protein